MSDLPRISVELADPDRVAIADDGTMCYITFDLEHDQVLGLKKCDPFIACSDGPDLDAVVIDTRGEDGYVLYWKPV